MSVPAFLYYDLWAENETGAGNVKTGKIKLPANNGVRAHVMLLDSSHNGQTSTWGVNTYINEFTQNGQPQQGQFPLVSGSGITELQFELDVYGTKAHAMMLVELF